MNQIFAFLFGAAVIAAVIASPARGIACNVGDLQSHQVALGFTACQAVYNFQYNSVLLSGSQEGRMPEGSMQVPGWSTVRRAECSVKENSGKLAMICRCFNNLCNVPMSPKDLLEEQFNF